MSAGFNLGSGVIQLYNGSYMWDMRIEQWWDYSTTNEGANFHFFTTNVIRNGSGPFLSYTNTGNGWYFASDLRIKRDISPISPALEDILKLTPVYFNYKSQPLEMRPICGFIAQDVEQIFPDLVNEIKNPEYDFNVKGIGIDGFIPYIVKAIQERQQIIDAQQVEIDGLVAEIKELNISQQAEIDALVDKLNSVKKSLDISTDNNTM